jgi:hypothetical protein
MAIQGAGNHDVEYFGGWTGLNDHPTILLVWHFHV